MKKKRIIVLGAGVTGLTAGWKLSEMGYDVEVLEKEAAEGGLANNTINWGLSFDTTPHAFHVHSERCLKEFTGLMGDELVSYSKHVELKHQGRYVRYPLTPVNMFFSLNFFTAMNCGLALLYAKIKALISTPEDSSAESWIINRYGKPLYQIVFKDYTTKIWGLKPSELAANFARLKIPNISFVDLFVRLFSNPTKFLGRTFKDAPAIMQLYYPKKGGIGRICEKLCRKIEENGGKVYFNVNIKGIELEDKRVVSISYNQNDGKTSVAKADYYFSTIPIVSLIELLGKKDAEILLAAKRLNYRSLIVAHLLVNKERVFFPQSIYYPTNRIFNRASDIRSFDKNFEPKDKTVLSVEITCQKDDELWNMDEKEFLNKVIRDLEEEDTIKREEVINASLVKIPYAYPRYDLGYERNMRLIINSLKQIDNLFVGGRQGLFKYLDMDACFETGLLVADKIKDDNFDFKNLDTDTDNMLLS